MPDIESQRRLALIVQWHAGAGPDMELHEYLGMDYDEYCVWIDDVAELVDA